MNGQSIIIIFLGGGGGADQLTYTCHIVVEDSRIFLSSFIYLFIYFLMNGNTEQAQFTLSRVCIPKKRKRKLMSSDQKKKKKKKKKKDLKKWHSNFQFVYFLH